MYNVFRLVMTSLMLITVLGFVGCGAPASKAPAYPALSDISPVPAYPDTGQTWNTNAVCWVGMTDDAKWKWNLPSTPPDGTQWVRRNAPETIQQLIRQELRSEGYEVKVFDTDYLTRRKRLMVEKLILLEGFDIKKTMIKDGACFDMKLTLKIMDNPHFHQTTQCEIWGRSLLSADETKKWEDITTECVSNILKAPKFRKALEPGPAPSRNAPGR